MCTSKLGCKNQESIQSSTMPAPGYQWESDKLTARHQQITKKCVKPKALYVKFVSD